MQGTTLVIFTVTLFLIAYAFIVTEKIHRTIAALVGAAIMVIAGIETQAQAIGHIDFNTIGLLVGMMIIVGITKDSGMFEFLAISAVKAGKGKPMAILIWLSLMTAIVSAFIDSVTCILLVIPITISIASKLNINPIPIVFSEIMLCNIGGAATLIGDPPNIMIGSAAGFSFNDFVKNMAPILIVIIAATLLVLWLIYRKNLTSTEEHINAVMAVNQWDEIKDKTLAKKSLIVILLTIAGFILHQALHLESATIALSGAALLMLLVRPVPERVFETIEWSVIFFFVGLFVLVGALQEVGVMQFLAAKSLEATGGGLLETGMAVLWVSAVASAFVDNIPFTATMIPVVEHIGEIGEIARMDSLWWSFALGACLGGNGTIVAASANVVAIDMIEDEGYHLSFLSFMKKGFPIMILSIMISTIYLYIFYWT